MIKIIILLFVINQVIGDNNNQNSDDCEFMFKRCSIFNQDFNDCITDCANDAVNILKYGVPCLNIPPMNPLQINELTFSDNQKLKFVMTNVQFYGFEEVKVLGTLLHMESLTSGIIFYFDTMKLQGNFRANGKIIGLPIPKEGYVVLERKNVLLKWIPEYSFFKHNDPKSNNTSLGDRYFNISGQHGLCLSERASYTFQSTDPNFPTCINLNKRLNKSWAYVDDKIFAPEWDRYIYVLVSDIMQKVVLKYPVSQMFKDIPY